MTTVMRRARAKAPSRIEIYTDGACSGSTGGWAWAVATTPAGLGNQGSGGAVGTTNQRMEMQAVIEALRAHLNMPVCIVTDSAYVMNCFVDKWYLKWTSDGRKRDGSPVANWDLWKQLVMLVVRNDVTWRKVKGHSGEPMNDFVDSLAVAAKRSAMVGA